MEHWPLWGKPVADTVKANDLCWVEVFFRGGDTRKHLIQRSEVDRLVEAYTKLHHTPGVNPYSKNETARIYKITKRSLSLQEDYWWTKPGLGKVDEEGAHIIGGGEPMTLWEDTPYIIQLCRNEHD